MQYILSLSYGKDSLACLEAIRLLGWPLDRIIHAEVWATDTIPADLPPMVEFKAKADAIIKERYGIEVEHVRAMQNSKTHGLQRLTFETMFYDMPKKRDVSKQGMIKGFPGVVQVRWCRKLKVNYFQKVSANENTVQYLGIAANEQERIKRHTRPGVRLPLVELGWDEARCRQWCEENGLLSPIYTSSARGGCWFCPNQPVAQLRQLRKHYPSLWGMLLKWDRDSPVPFKPDGRTVSDYDKRFALEERGVIPMDKKFRWSMVVGQKDKTII